MINAEARRVQNGSGSGLQLVPVQYYGGTSTAVVLLVVLVLAPVYRYYYYHPTPSGYLF